MAAYTVETIQKDKNVKKVVELVKEIRKRLESGHYNFMSWGGRTKLELKLNEYETYAMEFHKSRSATIANTEMQKLKGMETELRALLGSTY